MMLRRVLLATLLAASVLVKANATTPPPPRVLSIAMVGDVMIGSTYPSNRLPPSWDHVLGAPSGLLRKADLSIGNLEGAITTYNHSSKTGCNRCYAFRMPPVAAQVLAATGFDLMSVANNHANDFGPTGLRDSQTHLAQVGIGSTGAAGQPAAQVLANGKRTTMLAFAPNKGMNDVRNIPRLVELVRAARTHSDVVLVSFHAGAEGSSAFRTANHSELYLGENRGNVYEAARAAIDAGADMVFGHGPHLPRALDIYKGKLIAYSLGNFATYGSFGLDGALGYAPLLWVEMDDNNRPTCARIASFIQSRPGGARWDDQQRAARWVWARTQQDAPQASAQVDALFRAPCQKYPQRAPVPAGLAATPLRYRAEGPSGRP